MELKVVKKVKETAQVNKSKRGRNDAVTSSSTRSIGYWLMKSEPSTFSIADLKVKQIEHWDGVRNYMARNYMKNEMQEGDKVLFYHSSSNPSGVVGLASICSKQAYADFTAFDPCSQYYDAKSSQLNPIWYMVDVKYHSTFSSIVTLAQIKQHSGLKDMVLLRNSRLSVQPVTKEQYDTIVSMGNRLH